MMTGKLLDGQGRQHAPIAAYGLTVVGMAVLALICGGLSGRFGARPHGLRAESWRRCIGMSRSSPLPTIDKFSTSGIITRLTTDDQRPDGFMMVIRIAVRSPIMLICAWVLPCASTSSWH